MTAKKKPARAPRTTVTGWGVLLLPWNEKDKPMLMTFGWLDNIPLPTGMPYGTPLRFSTKKAAVAWWKKYRTDGHPYRLQEKVRIVRITGTYEEAKP